MEMRLDKHPSYTHEKGISKKDNETRWLDKHVHPKLGR